MTSSYKWPILFATLEKRKVTGAEIRPAIVCGIATGDAAVSYWPIYFFPCREKQSQKSLGNLIRPSFPSRCKVANKDEFYFVHAFVSFATD